MLHIILLILKIIGVILLAVLALLLFLLLVVLLVPVRYRLRASHGESLYLKGRVSWLLHLVHISATHMEGVLHIRARILGFIVYDNLRPPKPKKEKAKKAEKYSAKKRSVSNEKSGDIAKKRVSDVIENKSVIKEDDIKKAADNNTEDNNAEHGITEHRKEVISNKEQNNTEINNAKINPAESRNRENKSFHKLKNIPERLKAAYRKALDRIKAFRERIRSKYEKLKNIITDIRHKWDLIYNFWMDELNKQGMKYTFQSVKKLLKHILPTKLKSELIIGTGDPYSTGQVLSIISFFYGFYGDKVSVIPDFENSRFEGKHYARGRIRAATILLIVGRLLIDKRFKYLKKNFIILKEAL